MCLEDVDLRYISTGILLYLLYNLNLSESFNYNKLYYIVLQGLTN